MPNDNSPHMPDSPSSSFHTNMIAPDVLGVKIIGRLDTINTVNMKLWDLLFFKFNRYRVWRY